jgi:hypothetical protein
LKDAVQHGSICPKNTGDLRVVSAREWKIISGQKLLLLFCLGPYCTRFISICLFVCLWHSCTKVLVLRSWIVRFFIFSFEQCFDYDGGDCRDT